MKKRNSKTHFGSDIILLERQGRGGGGVGYSGIIVTGMSEALFWG